MKAISYRTYGSPDVLERTDVEAPEPRPNEILIRVEAASLGRDVWHLMAGQPYLLRLGTGLRAPRSPILGREVAGHVEAVGSGVTGLRAGQAVMGTCAGAFAEYACARESKVAPAPEHIPLQHAATVPTSGVTALQALRDHGRVSDGQRVLVIGASGGVGTFAVQLAKAFGAQVTGVCSAPKTELVETLGADRVVDYAVEDFADAAPVHDVILDIGGRSSLARLRRPLKPEGTLVIVGGEGGDPWTGGLGRQLHAVVLSPFVRQRLRMFVARENRADLERLTELIDAGQVRPVVDTTYHLEEVAKAIDHLTDRRARGKVLVTIP